MQRIAGVVLFTLLLPIIMTAAILTIIDTGTPVLYSQTRVGLNGTWFRIYKLRTYKDGRTTRFSRKLRSLGIDELPQLYNIIKGDMVLVGPRPELPMFSNFSDPNKRHSVKPGVTGLSQILGGHNKGVIEEVYDLMYVDNKSPLLDLYILALTVPVLLGYEPNKLNTLKRVNSKARNKNV